MSAQSHRKDWISRKHLPDPQLVLKPDGTYYSKLYDIESDSAELLAWMSMVQTSLGIS